MPQPIVPQRYMQDLEAWVFDQDKPVSYRWLAGVLSVHADTAKRMLYDFAQAHAGVASTYLITGKTKEQAYCAKLTLDGHLEATKQEFASINCVHVYSVARRHSEAVLDVLVAADFDQARELLLSPEGSGFQKNRGAIVLPGLKVSPPGARELAVAEAVAESRDPARSAPVPLKHTDSSKAKGRKPAMASTFFANHKPAQGSEQANEKNITTNQEASPGAKRKREGVQDVLEVLDDEPNEVANEPVKVEGKNAEPGSDEEVEWDEEKVNTSSNTKNTKQSAASKRQRKADTDPRDEPHKERENESPRKRTHDDDHDDDKEQESGRKGKRGRKSKSQETHSEIENTDDHKPEPVVGAMDNYFATNAEHNMPPSTYRVQRKKKLVEKTFTDEKGYLVTEHVWEEVAVQEDETPIVIEPAPKTTSHLQAKSSTGGSATKSKKSNAPAQKSIASFFSRK